MALLALHFGLMKQLKKMENRTFHVFLGSPIFIIFLSATICPQMNEMHEIIKTYTNFCSHVNILNVPELKCVKRTLVLYSLGLETLFQFLPVLKINS